MLDDEVEPAGVEALELAEELAWPGAVVVASGAEAEALEAPDPTDALSELVEADEPALSAAVTAGAGSLVLEPPLSPPPLLRKSVTYQPEPLS